MAGSSAMIANALRQMPAPGMGQVMQPGVTGGMGATAAPPVRQPQPMRANLAPMAAASPSQARIV